jgi:hypothetical protein
MSQAVEGAARESSPSGRWAEDAFTEAPTEDAPSGADEHESVPVVAGGGRWMP